VTDPQVFYGKQDFWALPVDPTLSSGGTEIAMRPYYVLMRLPGEADETFALILPFTPQDRQNMVAWMAAKSDPGPDYGDIVSFQFPSGQNVDGPTQVFSRINQDARFSSLRTLLGQGGSTVQFGDFLVIPVGDALLYVEPVYVVSTQANAIPELKRVVVVNGVNVGIGDTLTGALADSLGQPTGGGGGQPPPTGSVDQQVSQLLQQAADHFAAAQEALTNGDLATYQAQIKAAQAAVDQAQALLQAQPSPSGSPSPSGAPSGAPSPTASPSG
jgi:hypothetical protein